jgi:hypothetical protein
MLSSGDMDSLVKQILDQLGQVKDTPSGELAQAGQAGGSAAGCTGSNTSSNNPKIPLKTQDILVILGLASGVLHTHSVLVDTDQNIEILLLGSLKRPTRLDKCLDIIGNMPFDDVLKAIMNRLG